MARCGHISSRCGTRSGGVTPICNCIGRSARREASFSKRERRFSRDWRTSATQSDVAGTCAVGSARRSCDSGTATKTTNKTDDSFQPQVITKCSQGSCNQSRTIFGLTVPDVTNAANEHAGRVREMFSGIAKRYDLLNHLLSGNVDKRWRRVVASRVREKLSSSGARVLDVACGTGDLSLTLFESTGARVVGTDFCRPMLQIAAAKLAREIPLIEGDALNLPFR